MTGQQKGHPEKKSWLDVLTSLSTLISGVLLAGVGTLATYIYDGRQMTLNHLNALDKYRHYIDSENPVDRLFGFEAYEKLGERDLMIRLATASVKSQNFNERAFGYEAFALLGKEDFAVKLAMKRQDGDSIEMLQTLRESPNSEISSQAGEVASKLMASARPTDPDVAVPSDAEPPQSTVPANGIRTGWAYIGHYEQDSAAWRTQYFDFPGNPVPGTLAGKKLTVNEKTGALNVRSGMPSITGKFQPVIDVLKPGKAVEIIEIQEWHRAGYMWARVSYKT